MSNHGLRGHETVIRLVGKRRKLTLSAISPKKPVSRDIKHKVDDDTHVERSIRNQTTTHLRGAVDFHAGGGEGSGLASYQSFGRSHHDGGGTEQKVGSINWVKCPICEKSIRGDVINTHLDLCLQGGVKETKRKSKQLTMSQFGGRPYAGKLANQTLSVGFKKITSNEKQGEFVSVKVETSVTFGCAKSTDGQDCQIDGKANESVCVKLEEDITSVSSPPVSIATPAQGVRQTRMKLKRHAKKSSEEKSVVHPGSEELGLEVYQNGVSVSLLRSSLESTQLTSQQEKSTLSVLGCGKEERVDGSLGEPSSSHPVSESGCACHCHVSPLNGETMDTLENLVERENDDKGGMIGVDEKKDAAADEVKVEVPSTSLKVETDNLVGVIETKIVGRRFNRGTVCKKGMKVAFMREPENPKDPNAIKVIESEVSNGLALGHLPREISLHLSSLLDKGLLEVWGSVTSVPVHNFGAVPVNIFCQSESSTKEDFFRLDGAKESFQNILIAAESLNSLQLPFSGGGSKYQQNFLYMLQTVLERDSHLFKDEEKAFLESFNFLSDDTQRLFIRLYQRKGPWFRLSTVEYKDVADVGLASEELLAAGYMDTQDSPNEDPEAALSRRFQVLNVMELRSFVCTAFMKKKSEAGAAKKEELVNMAVSAGMQKHANLIPESSGQSGTKITEMLTEIVGKCVRVSDLADFLFWRLKRLFFLNGDTDLSAFLVVDLGIVKYPTYKCWRERNIFETHEALLAYEQALEVAQGMDMALECNDTETALKLLKRACHQMPVDDSNLAPAARTPTFLARFSASYVYRNVCTLGVSILERERRYPEAVDLLKQLLSKKTVKSGRWGYWTVRLSMDLDHLGRKEESLQVAEKGVGDPWIRGGDLVALQRRVVRLGKPPRRWKTPPYAAALKRNCKEVQIQGRPLNCVTGLKSWFYGYDGQQCRVEELALQYFASEEGGGWQGVHCEGGVWMTFFGLLMWDVLFAEVPDVFQTPFQTAPLDLDTEVFFSTRESLIEAQLAAIAEGDIANLLARTWTHHKGTMCRGVNWERHSLEELQIIALCIGGPGLSTICRLLAEDHAGWTGGMPDLLLWRTPDKSVVGHISEESKHNDNSCSNCSCNQIGKPLASTSQEISTLENSSQGKKRVNKGGCESRGSFTRTLSTNRSSKYGEAKLVEVKGPRDRLSEQQRAWIWILMNAGLTVEVCKVLEKQID